LKNSEKWPFNRNVTCSLENANPKRKPPKH
jgi:hypothetical protein